MSHREVNSKITVRPQWAHCYHGMVIRWSHEWLTASSWCELQTYMEGSQQAHCASSSCEFAVSYMSGLKMSLWWVFMWAPSESSVSSNSSLGDPLRHRHRRADRSPTSKKYSEQISVPSCFILAKCLRLQWFLFVKLKTRTFSKSWTVIVWYW